MLVEQRSQGQELATTPNNVSVNEAIGGIELLRYHEGRAFACTSGFGTKKPVVENGRRRVAYYLLTAGHCPRERANRDIWAHWNDRDPNRERIFGRTERNAYYYADPSDALAIRIRNPVLASSRMYVRYGTYGARTDARVKGASDFAVTGSLVCYSGATSSQAVGGRSICGQIRRFKHDLKVNGNVTDEGIEVRLADECRERGGDSGAGIWMKKRKTDKGIWALGLVAQGDPSFAQCGFGSLTGNVNTVIAQGIGPVLRKFKVSLNTQTATRE